MHYCHGQPGGVFSGHETIGGIEPNRGTETCDVCVHVAVLCYAVL